MCPECLKAPSPSCRYPSQQHWSWCSESERLREQERREAQHTYDKHTEILKKDNVLHLHLQKYRGVKP